jgi:cysteine desulfurase/selenocysteine lyase
VGSGLQCAPSAHDALGTAPNGVVRMSVGPATTDADIDAVLSALADL